MDLVSLTILLFMASSSWVLATPRAHSHRVYGVGGGRGGVGLRHEGVLNYLYDDMIRISIVSYMYIYMSYIYIYLYIYLLLCLFICKYIYIYINSYVYVYIYGYLCVCIYMYIYTYIHICKRLQDSPT